MEESLWWRRCGLLRLSILTPVSFMSTSYDLERNKFQSRLDATANGSVVQLSPQEFPGPVVIKRPLVLEGNGATIWNYTGPVISSQVDGVVLRNVKIEVTGTTEAGQGKDGCALWVKPGSNIQFENVEVRGSVIGLWQEEGEWRYPNALMLGPLPFGSEHDLIIRLYVPVPCEIKSNISGVELQPQQLVAGTNEVHLHVERLPQDTLLNGNLFITTAQLKRRITVSAHITSTRAKKSKTIKKTARVVWQPDDWDTLVSLPPPAPPKPPVIASTTYNDPSIISPPIQSSVDASINLPPPPTTQHMPGISSPPTIATSPPPMPVDVAKSPPTSLSPMPSSPVLPKMTSEQVVKSERSQSAAYNAERDPVDCTVFAPPAVSQGSMFIVQVFAHRPEQAAAAKELATEFDEAAQRRAFKSLEIDIPIGKKLHFHLVMPGLEIDNPTQALTWRGSLASVQFGVSVSDERKPGDVVGTVIISCDGVPIGHVKFKLAVVTSSSATLAAEPVGEAARHYQKAFVSYASQDIDEVLKRVQMLNLQHIDFFQDKLRLTPGQRWESKLYQQIDESDLFLLFWSNAAKQSEWVMKELQYALTRKHGDDAAPPEIYPVIIEGPPVVAPPPELAHLHFNDYLLYFMQRGIPDAGTSSSSNQSAGKDSQTTITVTKPPPPVDSSSFGKDNSSGTGGTQTVVPPKPRKWLVPAMLAVVGLALLGAAVWWFFLSGSSACAPSSLKAFLDRPYSEHTAPVNAVAFSADGTMVASGDGEKGGLDGTVKLWDAITGKTSKTLKQGGPVTSVAFSPDGKLLASGSDNASLVLWDTQTGDKKPLDRPEMPISVVAFTPDGKFVVACGTDSLGTVKFFATQNGKLDSGTIKHQSPVRAAAFSPDGKLLATGGEDGSIKIWNADTRLAKTSPSSAHSAPVTTLAFSSDNTTLASGSVDTNIILWDAQKGSKRSQLGRHAKDVTAIAFTHDGKWLISGGLDTAVKVWDVTKGEYVSALTNSQTAVYSVAVSSLGTVASASADKTVFLWGCK